MKERDYIKEKKEIWKIVKENLLKILPREYTLTVTDLEKDNEFFHPRINFPDNNYIMMQCDCDSNNYYGVEFYISSNNVANIYSSVYISAENLERFIANYNPEKLKSLYDYIKIINKNLDKLESVREEMLKDAVKNINNLKYNKKILKDLQDVIEDIENNRLYY